jgi:hypothetical protein
MLVTLLFKFRAGPMAPAAPGRQMSPYGVNAVHGERNPDHGHKQPSSKQPSPVYR